MRLNFSCSRLFLAEGMKTKATATGTTVFVALQMIHTKSWISLWAIVCI